MRCGSRVVSGVGSEPALRIFGGEAIKTAVLLAFLSGCVSAQPGPVVTYPAPHGGTVDMAEWMVMDPTLRGSHHMEPGTITSQAWEDKIVYTKFSLVGDNYDVWTFDENYIYGLTTGTPTTFVRSFVGGTPTNKGQVMLPRRVQLGFPGTRLVLPWPAPSYQVVTDCILGPVRPGSHMINELYGPFTRTFAGNIGTHETIEMHAYWDCSDTVTESCRELEVYGYTRPEGWVSWHAFRNPLRDGTFTEWAGSDFDNLTDGGSAFIDWCPSLETLLAPPPPVNKPISRWFPDIPKRRTAL